MLSSLLKRRPNGRRVGVELRPDGVGVALRDASLAGPPVALAEFVPAEGVEAQAAALAGLVERHRLAGLPAVGVLDPADYSLMQVEAPEVQADELRAAIRWRIKDLLPYPLEEAVVDVFAFPPSPQRARGRHVCAVSAPAASVQGCLDLLRSAGLEPAAVDIAELALRNAASRLPGVADGVALLALGERRSLVLVLKEGDLYLARTVEVGRGQVAGATAAGEVDREQEALMLELQRSLDYFVSFFGQAPVTRLLVHPAREDEPLLAFLNESLGLEARPLALEALTGAGPDPRCLAAMGAALREDVA